MPQLLPGCERWRRALHSILNWRLFDGQTDEEGEASPATHNRHLGTLHNLFGWLARQGEIAANPVSRLERRRDPERLPQPTTHDQLDTFYSRIQALRERALLSLLHLLPGLRC